MADERRNAKSSAANPQSHPPMNNEVDIDQILLGMYDFMQPEPGRLAEARAAIERKMASARLDELRRIQELDDGNMQLANLALKIGVYIDDRTQALQHTTGDTHE